jgi:hypothetical protein
MPLAPHVHPRSTGGAQPGHWCGNCDSHRKHTKRCTDRGRAQFAGLRQMRPVRKHTKRLRALLRDTVVLLISGRLTTRFEFDTGDGFFSLLLAITDADLASIAASNEMLAVVLLLVATSRRRSAHAQDGAVHRGRMPYEEIQVAGNLTTCSSPGPASSAASTRTHSSQRFWHTVARECTFCTSSLLSLSPIMRNVVFTGMSQVNLFFCSVRNSSPNTKHPL